MPAFTQLSDAEKKTLAIYVLDEKKEMSRLDLDDDKQREDPYFHLPYDATGYNKFLTREGYPAVMPPWGTLTAIDLNKGTIVWRDTLGDYPELKARGIHSGTENYGGPVVTAGGLLFIAATSDAKIHLDVKGAPPLGKFEVYCTSASQDCAQLADVNVSDGKASVTLPAQSVK